MTPNDRLSNGLKSLGYQPSEKILKQLLTYLELLLITNESLNLTAITDFSEAIDLHLLDSFTLKPWLDNLEQGACVLDIGSGAGLPGLPIAIMYPHLKVTLLDARKKKMLACNHFIQSLGLNNVDTVHARIEDFNPQEKVYACIVTRALSRCKTICDWVAHLQFQQLLMMKGRYPSEELTALTIPFEATAVSIPNRTDQRHIITVLKRPI